MDTTDHPDTHERDVLNHLNHLDHLDLAERQAPNDASLAEIRAELARVDAKAGNLLTLAGIAGTIGLTALGQGHLPPPAATAGWASAITIGLAVTLLALAVRPDLTASHGYMRRAHPKGAAPTSTRDEQLDWLARLTRRKFVKVRWAVDLLCLALAGTTLTAALTALL